MIFQEPDSSMESSSSSSASVISGFFACACKFWFRMIRGSHKLWFMQYDSYCINVEKVSYGSLKKFSRLTIGFGDGRVLRNSSTASLSNNHNINTIIIFDNLIKLHFLFIINKERLIRGWFEFRTIRWNDVICMSHCYIMV